MERKPSIVFDGDMVKSLRNIKPPLPTQRSATALQPQRYKQTSPTPLQHKKKKWLEDFPYLAQIFQDLPPEQKLQAHRELQLMRESRVASNQLSEEQKSLPEELEKARQTIKNLEAQLSHQTANNNNNNTNNVTQVEFVNKQLSAVEEAFQKKLDSLSQKVRELTASQQQRNNSTNTDNPADEFEPAPTPPLFSVRSPLKQGPPAFDGLTEVQLLSLLQSIQEHLDLKLPELFSLCRDLDAETALPVDQLAQQVAALEARQLDLAEHSHLLQDLAARLDRRLVEIYGLVQRVQAFLGPANPTQPAASQVDRPPPPFQRQPSQAK